MDALLAVRHLKVYFTSRRGEVVRAVDGVDLSLFAAEAVALVGESGCGKSTLARAILRLLPLTEGEVWFEGVPLHQLSEYRLRPVRRRMQMVFQDPMASLNPRMRVGQILVEPLQVHGLARGKEAWQRASELIRQVGLSEEHLHRYPHEFSGGQRQRVCIARAIATRPSLLVADEPTSALDLSIRAQIHALLRDLQQRLNMSILFVTHDLNTVRQVCSRVLVMYLGQIVEDAPVDVLFAASAHPYTRALLDAVLEPRPSLARRHRNLPTGDVPNAVQVPSGCRFHPRCPYAQARCRTEPPVLRRVGEAHLAACHYPLTQEEPNALQTRSR